MLQTYEHVHPLIYEVTLGWIGVIMLLQILFGWVKLNYGLLS